MGLKSYVKKYKDYESNELARRAAKKQRVKTYAALRKRPNLVKKTVKRFSARAYTTAIGNPYNVAAPKIVKKIKKKTKKRKLKKKGRRVVVIKKYYN